MTTTTFWSSLVHCLPWLQILVKLIIAYCLPLPLADKAVICITWCSAADMIVDLRLAGFSLCKDWFHQFFFLFINMCFFFNDVWWFVLTILIWFCLCLLSLVNWLVFLGHFSNIILRDTFWIISALNWTMIYRFVISFFPQSPHHMLICRSFLISISISMLNSNSNFMIYHKRTKILATCNMLFTLKFFVNQILTS